MAELSIQNDVPDSDPSKSQMEQVIRGALRDFAGAWHVRIRAAQTDPWWIVVVRRQRDGFRRTLLLDPRKQTPEAVGKSLVEALKDAV